LPIEEGINMGFKEKSAHPVQPEIECEIIQEIFGLGANSLLQEHEEEMLQRLMLKYYPKVVDSMCAQSSAAKIDEQGLELLIRKIIVLRKADFAPDTRNMPRRKETLVSAKTRSSSAGSADRAA
jgi:hypothetical protein